MIFILNFRATNHMENEKLKTKIIEHRLIVIGKVRVGMKF